ncbi:hypothetical protein Tco_0343074 [Tanacetum coccineum]
MADHLRLMEEPLRIPTYVNDEVLFSSNAIIANEFELKTELLDFVSNNSFFGLENDDPHSHIRIFYQITRTLKLNQVPDDVVKLILFPFSLKGAAETWLENEPPCSITSWDDLVSKWKSDDEKYSRTGGNLMSKNTHEALTIIENKAKLMQNQMGQMEETFLERPLCVPPSDTETYPRKERKAVTTMSGLTLDGSFIPDSNFLFYPEKDLEPETITEVVEIPSSQSTPLVPPLKTPPLSTLKPKEDLKSNRHQPTIPYPSRL